MGADACGSGDDHCPDAPAPEGAAGAEGACGAQAAWGGSGTAWAPRGESAEVPSAWPGPPSKAARADS
ncbi:hypothetical protein ADENT20671_1370 [Actinomyces denticolens]|nr:hypothetical protein ADENT20671_1370 [Actinomyces denticolens]